MKSSYRSPLKHLLVSAPLILLFVFSGCAGPDERGDEELTELEVQQRQRVIQPLNDVPEERRGPTAPTLMEVYVDGEGRIRVDLLPYILDPDPGPVDEPDLDEPTGPGD